VTRQGAAERVAKLRRLADDPRTPPSEAENARAQATKLAAEHSLGEADLELGRIGSAYDELVDRLEKLALNNPKLPTGIFGAEQVVVDVLHKLKQVGDSDKSRRLRAVTTTVRTAHLFLGNTPLIDNVKIILDSVLKNHGLTI